MRRPLAASVFAGAFALAGPLPSVIPWFGTSPGLGAAWAQATVKPFVATGTVAAPNREPLALAHVRLVRPGEPEPIAVSRVQGGGAFAIATTERGPAYLQVTAVGHDPVAIPVVLDRREAVRVAVTLAPTRYLDSLDTVRLLTAAQRVRGDSGYPMARDADGRYSFRLDGIPADSVAYQLYGIARDGIGIAGTEATRFAYDGEGGYWAIAPVTDGAVTILFDPAKRVRPTTWAPARVSVGPPGSFAARLFALDTARARRRTAQAQAEAAARARGRPVRYDWKVPLAAARRTLRTERDSVLRSCLFLELMDLGVASGRPARADVDRVFRKVPPESPCWMFVPEAMGSLAPAAASDAASRYVGYVDRMAATHPVADIRARALAALVYAFEQEGDSARATEYLERLTAEFPGSPYAQFARGAGAGGVKP